jgi:hypothetical protein
MWTFHGPADGCTGVIGWCIVFTFISGLLCSGHLLILPAHSADVTSTSGVLAYTMESTCPSGWNDLSFDSTYRGRLIKGWNQTSNVGTSHLSASTGNDNLTHVHPSWSRRLAVDDFVRVAPTTATTPEALDDNNAIYITEANSTMGSKASGIPSKFVLCT